MRRPEIPASHAAGESSSLLTSAPTAHVRAASDRLTRVLNDAKAELNRRVDRLFSASMNDHDERDTVLDVPLGKLQSVARVTKDCIAL